MLTIYRRHRKDCEHRSEGRKYRRCRCPIWVDGFLAGREICKSLDMADWQKAQEYVRDWESKEAEPKTTTEPVTVLQAGDRFVDDAKARNLTHSTIYKYHLLFRELVEFATKKGIRYLREIDLQTLDQFRSEWRLGPVSSLKKLERLRSFFRFSQNRNWVDSNPAINLRAPKVVHRPTLPFAREEMLKILAALDDYSGKAGLANAQRLRAFVLILRYSGLRIGDAVQCGPERLRGDKLFLYTQKTGVPVYCILPDFVLRAIEAAPRTSEKFFFWTGESTLHTAVGIFQRSLKSLFALAKVAGGHAHRFRDTFAVELLLAGVPLERVSVLLGHQSVRITERHYSPWVRSRQEQLDLRRVWERDPIALAEAKGTPEVHDGKRQINRLDFNLLNWCRRGESNPRPRDYETLALPLSYAGREATFHATNSPPNRQEKRRSEAVVANCNCHSFSSLPHICRSHKRSSAGTVFSTARF
jgi:integrase/recombinase XerD